MQQYYSSFKKYNEKGQRLSCFGREVGDNQLEIFILTCSKQDQFNKKVSKKAYQNYLNGVDNTLIDFHPEIYRIDMKDNKPLWTFLTHLKEKYYTLREKYLEAPQLIQSVKIEKRGKFSKRQNLLITYLSK